MREVCARQRLEYFELPFYGKIAFSRTERVNYKNKFPPKKFNFSGETKFSQKSIFRHAKIIFFTRCKT